MVERIGVARNGRSDGEGHGGKVVVFPYSNWASQLGKLSTLRLFNHTSIGSVELSFPPLNFLGPIPD